MTKARIPRARGKKRPGARGSLHGPRRGKASQLSRSPLAPNALCELVLVERVGTAAWLFLNRPEARNALSCGLVAALRAELAVLAALPEVTAVVLSGAGGRAFCAGADLTERLNMDLDETRAFLDDLGTLVRAVEDFPAPVIAAISGAALGGGFELALAADIRLADESAVLGLPEVRVGIVPGAGGTQRLSRLCGIATAKELILTGRKIDATTALRLGLVSKVVAKPELRPAVAALVAELGAGAPLALAQAKRAIDSGFGKPMPEALADERECYEVVLKSADRNEALRAFAEKRPPRFRGR
ncbi:MAG: enoyl-CoA hydratase/isomerase family protein [Deltaproteobacteria bacterium]|nr:enoyl-CoA hydratase/isomerase family protein [Deltaproteobacteria bacterium]